MSAETQEAATSVALPGDQPGPPPWGGPGTVQRVTLAAATAWMLLYTTYAITFRAEHQEPLLLGLSLLLGLVATAVALMPLLRHQNPALDRGLAVGLALAAAVVALCVQPFLTPRGLLGYANWPMGSMGVLVAALTMRHRIGSAGLAVLGLTLVNGWSVWRAHELDHSVPLTLAAWAAMVPFTFLLASWGVQTMLDRSKERAEEYRQRQVELQAESVVAKAVRDADDQRRKDLKAHVLPLLERLADGTGPIDEQTRNDAARAAAALRDDLQARSLLTSALRDQVRAARNRGVWVSLSCDADMAANPVSRLIELVREGLAHLLATLPPGALATCRVTSAPAEAVLLVKGLDPAHVREVLDTLRSSCAAAPDATLELDELDDEVLAHVTLQAE